MKISLFMKCQQTMHSNNMRHLLVRTTDKQQLYDFKTGNLKKQHWKFLCSLNTFRIIKTLYAFFYAAKLRKEKHKAIRKRNTQKNGWVWTKLKTENIKCNAKKALL